MIIKQEKGITGIDIAISIIIITIFIAMIGNLIVNININSQDTSIRMFVNDEGENETEVTGIPSSQIASMGNNNYYGSIKKTKYDVMFNLKFGKNTD